MLASKKHLSLYLSLSLNELNLQQSRKGHKVKIKVSDYFIGIQKVNDRPSIIKMPDTN